jgi:glycine cleavage system H protein
VASAAENFRKQKMSDLPSELRYAASHEWARIEEDGSIVIGITDHAQAQLGDVVYIELPDMGQILSAGEEAGVVESVKAASDVYAPISGEVIAINEKLEDEPETVNSEPYEDGWFYKLQPADTVELDSLLTSDAYAEVVASEE